MNEIEKYIENLDIEFQRSSFDSLCDKTSDEKLLFLYAYYHYFNADSSKLIDIVQGDVYDWAASDKITGIYIDQEADNCDVDAIISLYCDDSEFDFPTVLKRFKDAETVMIELKKKNINRPKIDTLFADEDYNFSPSKPLKIRIITNYNPKNASRKKAILNALQAMKPEQEYITYHISFGYDIECEILEIENPKEFVDNAIIKIDCSGNLMYYGLEKSFLVNISAKSLKTLYEQYGYRGLFAQNLRYYVKNTRIDDNILESINKHPEKFWYLNNGIIIICDDYLVEDDEIILSNFSIINGGQTTKLVGESDFLQDFYIQCKIVKNKYSDENERIEFIASVAEASNTQKPIKDKDLIANRIEQRLLKKQLASAGIYCQIKRGEKVNKKLHPAAWQNTTNEELGQLLLSFIYQKPGIARASKASICGNKERYNLLFNKKYDNGLLGDILKIKAYYKLWMNLVIKMDDGSDTYKVGLVNNGMLFMTAIVGILSKIYYHKEFIDSIKSAVVSEQKIEIVSQHDIDHNIFREDIDKIEFFSLFELCYATFYRPGYEFMKSFKGKYNNFSNFTKVNNNYIIYVFRQMVYVLQTGIPDDINVILNNLMYQATNEDIARDRAILNKFVNVVCVDIGEATDLSESTINAIKENLIAYRTKIYKLNRIKAYEVFKNISCDRISKFAPTNIDDLRNFRCLDEAQIDLYGQDIIDIVNRVLNQ